MKKILLALSFSTLLPLVAFSQNEWAPIGAKWHYHTVSLGVDGLLVITSIKDTIILDQNCKKLNFENISVRMNPDGGYYLDTTNYYNYFYYDQDKVYHYDPSGYFYKLYDFSINKGDTVLVRDSSFEGDFSYYKFEYIVDSVKSIDTDNITLSAFYTSPSQEADWCFSNFADPLPIIEKIGSTQKFLGTSKNIATSNSSCLNCYVDQEINYRSENLNDTTPCDFIFSLPTNPSQAQSFLGPAGSQQWNIIHFEYDVDDFPASTWCYILGSDTFLNEVDYKKILKRRYDSENIEIAGLIRETNDSVIYMKIGEDPEFLLYDFGADQGDTVVAGSIVTYQGEISNIYPFEYVVDSLGMHEIDGQMRYRVFLHGPVTEEGDGYSFSWVWGIGCLEEGLLYNPNELVGRDAYELLCYYENEDLLFHNEDYQNCNYSRNTGVEDGNLRKKAGLFPNPVTNISRLDLSGISEASSVRIFDITGREVIRFSEIDENLVLRAVDYEPGFYFLSVYSGLRVVESIRFVVK